MGIADKSVEQLTAATQGFVGKGKHVQVALNGSARNLWIASGLLSWFFGKPRILVATDDDLQLMEVDSGKSWVKVRPKSVISTYPRDTKLGPPKGVLSHKIRFPDGEKLYLHRVHFDQIRRIDGEVVEA
jgi:hypothetical protein